MADIDKPSMLTGFARTAKTFHVAGGLATRFAASKIGVPQGSKERHAQDLMFMLGTLKGPLVKAAQFLSAIPGFLPDEYVQELQKLQAQAPSMGRSFVQRRLRGELGNDWQSKFKTFDMDAISAASLGQVHKAEMPDGTKVACKLQYPAMEKSLDSDLRQLKAGLNLYETFGSAVRQGEVFQELSERLREELDYKKEANNLAIYSRIRDDAGMNLEIPRTIESVSTNKLLVMDWKEGMSFEKFLASNPSQEVRNHAARSLFLAWYIPFYRYGCVHGDPHPGNFLFDEKGNLTLLDLGSIRIFRPRFVKGVVTLRQMLKEGRLSETAEAFKDWGFDRLTPEVTDALNRWMSFFLKPFITDGVYDLENSSSFKHAQNLMTEVHSALKKAGGVTLPREFVLLDRSAIGLGSAFLRLKAKLDWSKLFDEAVGKDFSEEKVRERQEKILEG